VSARDHAAQLAALAALTDSLRAYRDALAQRPLPQSDDAPEDAIPSPDAGWVPRRAARPRRPLRPVGLGPGQAIAASEGAAADKDATELSPTVLALPQPDLLLQVLTVSGPADDLARFRQAAAGPGLIPWSDDRPLAEDLVDHLVRADPGPGARAEAQGLVDRVLGLCRPTVRMVPLDLHALVPVPAEILALGPADPRALAWLWTHWGTTQALRPAGPVAAPDAPTRWTLSVWTADWTPWRALARIRTDWPALSLTIRPVYELG